VEDIAWRIRCGTEELHDALEEFGSRRMVRVDEEADLFIFYVTNFSEYLADKRDRNVCEYKEWRSAVYRRDRFTCRKCGKPGPRLHAHHILAWHDHTESRYDIDNGVTLCERCHRDLHRRHHGDMA
jgi:hypothetical protein